MKLLYLISLFPLLAFSQETEQQQDSIANTINPFIEDHNNQLNIKFDITNDYSTIFIPYEGEKATFKSNLKASYGFVFSYRFLSIRLGIRPGLSASEEKNKGNTDYFRFKVKLLFDKWIHHIEYNYQRGFYIENTQDISSNSTNSDFYIQFPHLTSNSIAGSSQYKFNKNYSVKAVESNTEIQLKSAGTFMVGLNYNFYGLKGTDAVKQEDGDEIEERTEYNDYLGFSPILAGGYYYTFVLHSYWYVNIRANPGLGFDFYKITYYSESGTSNKNKSDVFFALNSGVSAGYNGKKFYFGGEYNYNIKSKKYVDDNVSLQPITDNFHVFVGYRFKAPKQVRKPIELIEDKVPILKNDGGENDGEKNN